MKIQGGTWGISVYNNTWGNFAPKQNVSYPGKIRFTFTDHSEYGCQAIILAYNFGNLKGPYIHDRLFEEVLKMEEKYYEKEAIYEMKITFRNYRFYWSKPVLIIKKMKAL